MHEKYLPGILDRVFPPSVDHIVRYSTFFSEIHDISNIEFLSFLKMAYTCHQGWVIESVAKFIDVTELLINLL